LPGISNNTKRLSYHFGFLQLTVFSNRSITTETTKLEADSLNVEEVKSPNLSAFEEGARASETTAAAVSSQSLDGAEVSMLVALQQKLDFATVCSA